MNTQELKKVEKDLERERLLEDFRLEELEQRFEMGDPCWGLRPINC